MIEVSHLTKRYGESTVVNDLSFSLAPGEILGFLGPNGAGKSTTMKMLTGYLRPTAGSVSVLGCDVVEDTLGAQRRIGYLPEGAPAYEEMTPLGFLQFIAETRGFRGQDRRSRLDYAVETMSLAAVLEQRIETLSKGFKRRVGMAQAILHDPDVLILDEPTDGLDPNQKHQVREMITGLSKDKIVIISTHILEEVTAVCNRAMVLASGNIVSDSTPEQLMQQSDFHGAVTLRFASALADNMLAALHGLDGVSDVQSTDTAVTVIPEGTSDDLLTRILALSHAQGWVIASIYQEPGRLDEVFRKLTAGGAR